MKGIEINTKKDGTMSKIIALFVYFLISFMSVFPVNTWSSAKTQPNSNFVPDEGNQAFRNQIIQFIRAAAVDNIAALPQKTLDELDSKWNNHYQKTDWSVHISVYHQGIKMDEGSARGAHLADTLQRATEAALAWHHAQRLSAEELNQYRFKVTFDYYPARLYSFIEYEEQGLELTGKLVAVRTLDSSLLAQQITRSQNYLLRVMHPQLYGFFKFYNAAEDKPETLLRTIYSASSLYTLLKLYAFNNDPQLEQKFKPIASFILSNQLKQGPNAGGFYYGYNPAKKTFTCKVVVGTASKTIFTLLELNRFYTNEPGYLKAAQRAGDWLLTMVHQDGKVTPVASCDKGSWQYQQKQSLLYSGQVLSALSRLYAVTRDPRYKATASRIAQHFVQLVNEQGTLLGDDFRPANSISTSWVMMSLIDYAKINDDPKYRNIIEQLAEKILSRQIINKEDIYSNGRYLDAMTTSGNGWINEVMGVLHDFCKSRSMANCHQYQQAMVLTSRWLVQNAYSRENTYNVKNPAIAIGGFITNFTTQTVRTDAVCHGVNSLINLLTLVGTDEQVLVDIPERPLQEVLPLLRAGNGFL